MIEKIVKRDGRIVPFDKTKIAEAIWKAAQAVGGKDKKRAYELADKVVELLEKQLKPGEIPTVEQVQDLVEKVLVEEGHYRTAKAYILYRALHNQIRELVDGYLNQLTWLVKENANMTYSLQGLNTHISSRIISQYWLHRIYLKRNPKIAEAHINGDFHIHNLQILGPYCVKGNEIVCGDYKPIANYKTGEHCLGFSGRVRINKTFKRKFSGKLVRIKACGILPFKLTPEHPLLVVTKNEVKWKKAKDVKIGERLILPRIKGFINESLIDLRNFSKKPEKMKIRYFPLNKRTAWLLGIYVAEGSSCGKEAAFCFGKKEKRLIDKVRKILKSIGVSTYLIKQKTGIHVRVESKVLTRALKEWCGNSAKNKRIPQFILYNTNEKILTSFLKGYIAGDGCVDEERERCGPRVRMATVSKVLALQLQLLCSRLGIFASICKLKKKENFIEGRKIKSGIIYEISYPLNGSQYVKKEKTYFSTPIREISKIWYKGYVYNLETSDYTYLLNNIVVHNCVGWDIRDLLLSGFTGVRGKISSKPPKHFRVALLQAVNFIYTLTGEAAGAQAFSNFDTYLAPFIRYDNLNYREVKQALQEFMFNMNVPTRVGFQSPFSNITLDLKVPEFMKNEPVIIGGKLMGETYGDFQEEMDMFNKALAEVMLEGDGVGRVFSFPIPTINITKDFDWESEVVKKVFETSAKYGIPYFANFINSDMKPEDVRSMCLHPAEEILIQNSGKIARMSIKNLISKYAEEFDEDGWASLKKDVKVLTLNPKTFELEWQKIKRFVRKKTSEFIEIITSDGKVIRVTTNHPIIVLSPKGLEIKLAREIQENDVLLSLRCAKEVLQKKYQKIKIVRKRRFKILDSQLKKLHKLGLSDKEIAIIVNAHKDTIAKRRRKLGLLPNPPSGKKKESLLKLREEITPIQELKLDEKLAAFLGFFTADGNYLFENRKNLNTYKKPRGIQLNFNKKNKLLKEKIKKLIKKVLNIECKEKDDPRWNVTYLYIYNSEIARAFYDYGFKKYGRLPDILFNSPQSVIKSFLYYFFLGDGYQKRREIHINDEELSRDLVILCSLVGIPTCYKRREKSQRIHFQHKSKLSSLINPTLYELLPGWVAKSTTLVPGLNKKRMVGIKTLLKYNALTEKAKQLAFGPVAPVRVKAVNKIKLSSPQFFFDFEVENNHLFVHSLGTITHNCCRLRIDQRELRKRGGGFFGANPLTGCYDENTEILTENGWKLFKDLSLKDRVFTLNKKNEIELHYPTKLFEYDYEGEMIHFKSKSLDLLVTPNHRMVVDTTTGKRIFVEARNFVPNTHRIPKGGIWKGEEKEYFILPPIPIMQGAGPVSRFSDEELRTIRELKKKGYNAYQIAKKFNCNLMTIYNILNDGGYGNRERAKIRAILPPLKIRMSDWLKFFGFWLAKGSTDNEKIAKTHGYRVIISQVNKKKREEIKKVLEKLPFNYYEEGPNLVICNKQLWSYLRQFGNKYEKFIPQEIKNLNKDQLKILFDWMVKGDGYIRESTGQINYCTSSKRLADDLQEIVLKLGWLATISSRKKKISKIKGRKVVSRIIYTIGVQKSKHYRLRERNIKRVYYKGKVYCCEVENHTVFVRRNGKVSWCGNSIGVVTINLPRIGFLSKDETQFFERLDELMELAKESLEIKRKVLEEFTEKGLYPYSKFYLRNIKKEFGEYWKNHFSTIGLIGMNEACLNFLGCSIAEKEGWKLALKVLDFMRDRLADFQIETGNIYNLEATPAEGSSYSLAKTDKEKYPDIIVANEEEVKKRGAAPYYTSSTFLPVYYTDDLWELLKHQDPLQVKYTGGTVVHIWLGESNPPVESAIALVRKICENFRLPYFTLTPTFSICPTHGYLKGEVPICPTCNERTEVYSRVVGYLRPVDQWNPGKQEEFKQRKKFDKALVS